MWKPSFEIQASTVWDGEFCAEARAAQAQGCPRLMVKGNPGSLPTRPQGFTHILTHFFFLLKNNRRLFKVT